jgi:hypothetical protein
VNHEANNAKTATNPRQPDNYDGHYYSVDGNCFKQSAAEFKLNIASIRCIPAEYLAAS